MTHSKQISRTLALCWVLVSPVAAQDIPEAFSPENAVVDTAVPFAIGAREERQELRSSFGWSTFQEGLVEGVYYRFDPDGYARFAPTPRLDVDVFEVICRPRTTVCLGRKEALQAYLTARGQVQLKYDGVTEEDRFFLVDGLTELELPGRVLQPLDPAFESLLMSGGDLVVRRNTNEVDRMSLIGFSAVIGYLRWVAGGQNYAVLPRGWPVPSSGMAPPKEGLTSRAGWQQSGAQQPFQLGLTVDPETPAGSGQALDPAALARVAGGTGTGGQSEPPLLEMQSAGAGQMAVSPNSQLPALSLDLPPGLTRVRQGGGVLPSNSLGEAGTLPGALSGGMVDRRIGAQPTQAMAGAEPGDQGGSADMARRLTFLLDDVGLDLETALMVLRLSGTKGPGQQGELNGVASPLPLGDTLGASGQGNQRFQGSGGRVGMDLIDMISSTLPTQAQGSLDTGAPAAVGMGTSSQDEFTLLSDYFRSVLEVSQ